MLVDNLVLIWCNLDMYTLLIHVTWLVHVFWSEHWNYSLQYGVISV